MVIAGGNAIADFPYVWGGGHGSFQDSGYDCSGSVSYALAAAGLLDSPMASGPFMKYGEPGRGKWITIYANGGHMFMVVGGLRFDTSGRSGKNGSRWQAAPRSLNGFVARHPPGL
jgi:cell wall-associated NlpC family hydrolase